MDISQAHRAMTPRAARTIALCRGIALAVMIAGVIAVIPTHKNWFWAISIVVAVAVLQSGRIYVGYFPLKAPDFDDQVAGLMLGGTSEEVAVAQVSRGMAGAAIFILIPTILLCVMIVFTAYGVSFRTWFPPDAIGVFVAHAALWLVGIALVCIVLPFVLLALSLRPPSAKSRRPQARENCWYNEILFFEENSEHINALSLQVGLQ